MIYLLRFPAVGGETGKASTRKVLALRLSPPRDNLSRSRFLGLGAPSSFSCPVIRQLYSAWRSHITERAARRDRRPTCPLADRGRGAANPVFGVGVVRSFPWRKSQRTHRLAPRIMLGAAHYSVMERKKTSSYYKVVVIRVPLQGQNATIDKVLWIGLNLLPQDGFGKAPTTALCF